MPSTPHNRSATPEHRTSFFRQRQLSRSTSNLSSSVSNVTNDNSNEQTQQSRAARVQRLFSALRRGVSTPSLVNNEPQSPTTSDEAATSSTHSPLRARGNAPHYVSTPSLLSGELQNPTTSSEASTSSARPNPLGARPKIKNRATPTQTSSGPQMPQLRQPLGASVGTSASFRNNISQRFRNMRASNSEHSMRSSSALKAKALSAFAFTPEQMSYITKKSRMGDEMLTLKLPNIMQLACISYNDLRKIDDFVLERQQNGKLIEIEPVQMAEILAFSLQSKNGAPPSISPTGTKRLSSLFKSSEAEKPTTSRDSNAVPSHDYAGIMKFHQLAVAGKNFQPMCNDLTREKQKELKQQYELKFSMPLGTASPLPTLLGGMISANLNKINLPKPLSPKTRAAINTGERSLAITPAPAEMQSNQLGNKLKVALPELDMCINDYVKAHLAGSVPTLEELTEQMQDMATTHMITSEKTSL